MDKYINKGYTGLKNLGNTCFLNSCIQILSHTYELTEIIQNANVRTHIKPDIYETCILKEYNALRELMWSQNAIVSPNKFVYMVHKIAHEKNKDIFTGWAQNDMTEFLQFITDCFHTSISRPRLAEKEYSEITELFYGTYSSKIMSIENGDTHTTNNETFFVLDLPIPENIPEPTLYDCFRKFTEKEILGEDNKWYNEKTGLHENIMKQYDFIKFPHILVIMLKRFRHDTINKNGVLVNFPFEMDLGEFCGATAQYSLYGVCNHFGNALFGHYTSFVKTATNEWIHFNDETLEKIAPQGVVTTAAYCLFYRRAGVI